MARQLATPRLAAVAVAVILALASCVASQAPAPAPGPSSSADCSSAVTSLIGCATYVQPGSTQSKPPKACCDGVKSAMMSPAAIQCLCDALGKDYGIPLNMTRAAGLPAACGGDPAAFSKCNIKLPGAPTEAPAPTSGSTPAASSPGESKSAAARLPISAVAVVAAVAAPLLSYYYL